jgi:DNA-binding MarR family transcriptional regulator
MAVRSPTRHAERDAAAALVVLNSLWRLFHALEVRSKRMKRTIGVTGPQRLVLRVLGEQPRAGARQVAEALAIDPSTLTGILRRLEEAGLIERSPDPGDGRRAMFRLTRKGSVIDAKRRGTVEDAVRRTIASVPRWHTASFQTVIHALVERLESDA